jgi:acyl-homoserine lactone acylase PvdQ
MIHPFEDKEGCKNLWSDWIGLHVFYQQPHMASPEYGVVTSIQSMPVFVHVRFNFDTTSKSCRPQDLHWPPDFCAADRCNPVGQPFSTEIP